MHPLRSYNPRGGFLEVILYIRNMGPLERKTNLSCLKLITRQNRSWSVQTNESVPDIWTVFGRPLDWWTGHLITDEKRLVLSPLHDNEAQVSQQRNKLQLRTTGKLFKKKVITYNSRKQYTTVLKRKLNFILSNFNFNEKKITIENKI